MSKRKEIGTCGDCIHLRIGRLTQNPFCVVGVDNGQGYIKLRTFGCWYWKEKKK